MSFVEVAKEADSDCQDKVEQVYGKLLVLALIIFWFFIIHVFFINTFLFIVIPIVSYLVFCYGYLLWCLFAPI